MSLLHSGAVSLLAYAGPKMHVRSLHHARVIRSAVLQRSANVRLTSPLPVSATPSFAELRGSFLKLACFGTQRAAHTLHEPAIYHQVQRELRDRLGFIQKECWVCFGFLNRRGLLLLSRISSAHLPFWAGLPTPHFLPASSLWDIESRIRFMLPRRALRHLQGPLISERAKFEHTPQN